MQDDDIYSSKGTRGSCQDNEEWWVSAPRSLQTELGTTGQIMSAKGSYEGTHKGAKQTTSIFCNHLKTQPDQTAVRRCDFLSLTRTKKKKKRRKNPLFLPPNSADQWHSSPPSSWVLQHALKPSHSQQQGPDGGSWSKGKLRCLQLSSKGCKDMGVPWGDAPMGAALCPASQHSSRRLSPRQGKPWAIPVIYTWAQLNEVDPKLSPSVEQTVLNCWTKGYFRIWQYTTEAPYEHLCKAGIYNWVS